jgi:hypothetical protein
VFLPMGLLGIIVGPISRSGGLTIASALLLSTSLLADSLLYSRSSRF